MTARIEQAAWPLPASGCGAPARSQAPQNGGRDVTRKEPGEKGKDNDRRIEA